MKIWSGRSEVREYIIIIHIFYMWNTFFKIFMCEYNFFKYMFNP